MLDCMLAAVVINGSFLFWLFSAPLIRYGCVYVWLAPAVTFGGLAVFLLRKGKTARIFWRAAYVAIGLAGCYKAFALGREILTGYTKEFFVVQKDYENFTAESYEIGDITFYYPAEGDRIGYDAFPSSPDRAMVELLGKGLEDGFRYKDLNR